eukprot:scaffold3360_cov112-Isochrysis_galbana.AAC.8
MRTVSWSTVASSRSSREERVSSRAGRRSMKCSCATIVFTEAKRRGTAAYMASHCGRNSGVG